MARQVRRTYDIRHVFECFRIFFHLLPLLLILLLVILLLLLILAVVVMVVITLGPLELLLFVLMNCERQ